MNPFLIQQRSTSATDQQADRIGLHVLNSR